MSLNAEEFGTERETFLEALRAEGVSMSSGYPWPLYDNPMFDKSDGSVKGAIGGFRAEPCPVTERLCSKESVWVGQNTLLADQAAMNDIAEAVAKVQRNVDQLQAVYS
jgi:dTDP-4-amino-4,6-dideoxygalactose transaminase